MIQVAVARMLQLSVASDGGKATSYRLVWARAGFRGETNHNLLQTESIYLCARHVHAYVPPHILFTYQIVRVEVPGHGSYNVPS